MAPHSSTLVWKTPWMEEPGGLQSMGSLWAWHNWATLLSLFTFLHWRRKWQPTPVFLPGESQGWQSLVGCHLWGPQSRTRLKRLSSSSSSFILLKLIFNYQETYPSTNLLGTYRLKATLNFSFSFPLPINPPISPTDFVSKGLVLFLFFSSILV